MWGRFSSITRSCAKGMRPLAYKMILVAPSIPLYRRYALEGFGIRCVEVPGWPERGQAMVESMIDSRNGRKREGADAESSRFARTRGNNSI